MKPKMVDPGITVWQAVVGQVIAIFGLVSGYVAHSTYKAKEEGRRTERMDQQYRAFTQESNELKLELRDFRAEVAKMREAFAALTGKTINGATYRGE